MTLNRRDFMLRSGASLAAGLTLPRVLVRTAAALGQSDPRERILVLLQLSGGNDGLNTVVPYRDDAYYRLRPTLAIKPDTALKLDDHVGLHPQLDGLRRLYDDGWLSVVQGVGYPNPNRSHFESMDIWHSADPTLEHRETGWLGRVLEREKAMQALHLADEPLPLALRAEGVDVPSVHTIDSFRLNADDGGAARRAIFTLLDRPDENCESHAGHAGTPPGGSGSEADFVRRTAAAACANARRLEALPPDASGSYPQFGLARRLHEIARLIAADFGPRIYYTSLGGFDTHARQNTVHPNLMAEIGQSVHAFYADLKARGVADRVLLVTFSEFGRRAAENASLGTDHGIAAPLFAAGPGVRGGVIGPSPNLSALVDGDVPHAIDFRAVYAAILERWLKVSARAVLGAGFRPVEIL
ncbi:MAG: hypothetical protein CHACPFDD_02890 [Phycisphaerae bacterium]|nr:hypothetical protein [Phycisphaerae bacterium]